MNGGAYLRRILIVDKDTAVYEKHIAEWAKYDIDALRVDSMYEALLRIIHGDKFYFIVINEDSVPNFILQLSVMRDATVIPILIYTSSFTVEKKIMALENGADMYDPFADNPKNSVLEAIEHIKVQNRWADHPDPLPVLIGGDIILSPSRRIVIFNDKEVHLARKEFEVLEYLMSSRSKFIEHAQLMHDIWHDESDHDHNVLYQTIYSQHAWLHY